MTGNVNAIQREILHASAEYIPEGVVSMDDDQVLAHMKTTQSEQHLKRIKDMSMYLISVTMRMRT